MEHTTQSASLQTSNIATQAPSISSSAMLVELNISVWTGRKFDKTVSQEIDQSKHTTTRAGNYNKKLFADEPVFDAIGKFAGNARTFHYYATMPWSDSGLRLLTTKMYFDYQAQITQKQAEFYQLTQNFLDHYDDMIARAHTKLGSLFNPEDYPSKDQIQDKFRFSVKYCPVPEVGDFRVDVNNEALQFLQTSYSEYYDEQIKNAYADVWQRTHEALTNMSTKLAGEKKQIFRDSLVSNVAEVVDLLDAFNITDDPKMRQARSKIQSALSGITPEALREDDALRLDTKQRVDDLLKEFAW